MIPDDRSTSLDPGIGPDVADRVTIDDPESAAWWASHLGVSLERLHDAVRAVGTMPSAVQYFLRQSQHARAGRMKPRPEQPRPRANRRTRGTIGSPDDA